MVCFLIAFITVQQVCALAALTIRKHRLEGKNPVSEADLEQILRVTMKVLNSLRFCVDIVSQDMRDSKVVWYIKL